MIRTFLAALALAAAACSPAAPPEPTQAPAETAPPAPVASETIGGDGSEIALLPLTGQTLPDLGGELNCSFSIDGAPHLIGSGIVASAEPSRAAVNHNGYVEMLISTAPGGYDAMVGGARFGGRGLVVTVTPAEEQPTGNEQVAYNAAMLVQRADGAERTYQGVWTCGP